jgi:MFS family permease
MESPLSTMCNLWYIVSQDKSGEFDWSETTQGTILSAYYWGKIILPLPAGRLADVIGGRRVMGIALLITALVHVITPTLVRLHYGFFIAIRTIQGLAMVRPNFVKLIKNVLEVSWWL